MGISENVVVALVAGLFGLAPLMLQWLNTKAQRRDRSTRLKSLQAELEFLQQVSTLQAQTRGGGDPVQHQTELEVHNAVSNLLDRYNALKTLPSTVGAVPRTQPVPLFRRLLLLYTPETVLGWVWHSLFYIVLFITLVFEGMIFLIPPYDTDSMSGGLLILVVILGPLLLILQRSARRQAKQAEAAYRDEIDRSGVLDSA